MGQSDKDGADKDEECHAFQKEWHFLGMDNEVTDYEQAEHYDSIIDYPIDIHYRDIVQDNILDIGARASVHIGARKMIENQAASHKNRSQNERSPKILA